MNEATYRLELLAHVKMHSVFHVSFLKKALSRFDNALLAYIDVQEVEQEVHDPIRILDERSKRLQNREIVEYLVEWSNKPLEEATWEFATFLETLVSLGTMIFLRRVEMLHPRNVRLLC